MPSRTHELIVDQSRQFQEYADTEDTDIILAYWVQDHIHGQTKFLIRAWLEWKSKDGFKPGSLYRRKGTSSCEWWKVEEMGYAFQKLDEQKRKLIAAHFSMAKTNGSISQDFEDFKEAFRRRADRITEQWKEAGAFPGGGEGAFHGRQGRRAIARCYAIAAGIYTDPDALPIEDSKELMKATGRPLLTGWKEIAQAVGNVSVRTAQRWALNHWLPVGRAGTTVVADPEEIREWKERQRGGSEAFP